MSTRRRKSAERIRYSMGLNGKRIAEENVIEFVKGSEMAAVTFCQRRYKSRIKKLAAERPEECQIVAENQNGSLFAHIPVSWIKINPSRRLTEEQRERKVETLRRNFSNADNNRGKNG